MEAEVLSFRTRCPYVRMTVLMLPLKSATHVRCEVRMTMTLAVPVCQLRLCLLTLTCVSISRLTSIPFPVQAAKRMVQTMGKGLYSMSTVVQGEKLGQFLDTKMPSMDDLKVRHRHLAMT